MRNDTFHEAYVRVKDRLGEPAFTAMKPNERAELICIEVAQLDSERAALRSLEPTVFASWPVTSPDQPSGRLGEQSTYRTPAQPQPDPPWRWRNCRHVEVSCHLHLLPTSWRFRTWWQSEVYSLAAGIHLWFVSIHLWCGIGDKSDPTWRGRLSLSDAEAWHRATGSRFDQDTPNAIT